jgi:hypothetical protein
VERITLDIYTLILVQIDAKLVCLLV